MLNKNKISLALDRNEGEREGGGGIILNQVLQDLSDKLDACTYICNVQNLTNNGLTRIFYFTVACEKNWFDLDALIKRNFASLNIICAFRFKPHNRFIFYCLSYFR